MGSLGTDFDSVLTHAALAAIAGAGAWAVLVVASLAAEAGTHGRVRIAQHLGCPRAIRTWVLGVLLTLFAGIAPAHAHDVAPGSGVEAAVDGLPLPERPGADAPRRGRASAHRDHVVVEPGDSLWSITAERLPEDAGRAEVAAAVTSVYAANRAAIGPDPDLLVPGEGLVLPRQLADHFPDPSRRQTPDTEEP